MHSHYNPETEMNLKFVVWAIGGGHSFQTHIPIILINDVCAFIDKCTVDTKTSMKPPKDRQKDKH